MHNSKLVKKLIAAVGPPPEITFDIGIVYSETRRRYIACCGTHLPLDIGELKLQKLRTYFI